jgi:hypothetical protein
MTIMGEPLPIIQNGSISTTNTTTTTVATTSGLLSSDEVAEKRPQKRQCTAAPAFAAATIQHQQEQAGHPGHYPPPYFPILENIDNNGRTTTLSSEEDDDDDMLSTITNTYKKYQALYLPNFVHSSSSSSSSSSITLGTNGTSHRLEDGSSPAPASSSTRSKLNWKDMGDIFNHLNKTDQLSFCIENDGRCKSSVSTTKKKGTAASSSSTAALSASTFLRPEITNEIAYCSYLVQRDTNSLNTLLEKLPVQELTKSNTATKTKATKNVFPTDSDADHVSTSPSERKEGDDNDNEGATTWDYEPCIWIFFGRNNPEKNIDNSRSTLPQPTTGTAPDIASPTTTAVATTTITTPTTDDDDKTNIDDLQGRPEHTDSISHDGTWHYQLSGIKRWILRPTKQLLRHFQTVLTDDEMKEWNNNNHQGDDRIQIDCKEGDVLIVNTRLWFHQTILPPQYNPSVSYARDFWINKSNNANPSSSCSGKRDPDDLDRPNKSSSSLSSPASKTPPPATGCGSCSRMTNLDGLYATDDIEPGTVIFTETDMPDCELHRSVTDPNCEVVELEGGIHAIVSCRAIRAGEFFCIPESDDDDDEEEDDDEEGDGDDGDGEEDGEEAEDGENDDDDDNDDDNEEEGGDEEDDE